MSEWQPIETAPKDESIILVYSTEDGWAVATWNDGNWWTDGGWSHYPTHWMPLPPAPEQRSDR